MADELPEIADEVDQDIINAYADLSGDYNPLHVDLEAAAASPFGGTIAHGPIALQAFFRAATAWLGTDALPAGTTVKVTYRAPVRPGDRVRCVTQSVRSDDSVAAVDAECVNQDDTTVVTVAAEIPRAV
jgi:3-hydroxybutyryl-CoA dehydratase